MNIIRTRVHVLADGSLIGHAPGALAGEHDAEIVLHPISKPPLSEPAIQAIQALQDELARLPVLDPRTPDEILGYNGAGLFD
jgi:hypothetical protein